MKILVDSGATKAEWCVLDKGAVLDRFLTPGVNLAVQDPGVVEKTLSEASLRCSRAGDGRIAEVRFFGAGLIHGDPALLRAFFPEAEIEAVSDLVAAARSVCGRREGIACILGTGSNSCLYDGEAVVANVHPCGYVLGDEGGAACLGKRFLGAFLKGLAPKEVAEDFKKKHDPSDYAGIVARVYRGEAPARYLGSIAPWIMGWYGRNPWMTDLVEGNLRDFVECFLKQYDGWDRLPVGVVGSFGDACQDILRRVAPEIRFDRFLPAPMDGLIDYYSY